MRSTRPRLAAVLLLVAACEEQNEGVAPPEDRMFFPAGLLLDPRTPEGEAAKYLIVSNGNNDLSYNAGTITVFDLDAFFASWATETGDDAPPDYVPYPYCEGPGDRCVLDVGSRTSEDFPCRRLGLLPQVVECDERWFAVDSVRVGDFATVMAATTNEPPRREDPDEDAPGYPRLFVPVRGDPSVTYIDVAGDYPNPPDLQCGQPCVDGSDPNANRDEDDPQVRYCPNTLNADDPASSEDEAIDQTRCSDLNRLRRLRNDESQEQLSREPFNVAMVEGPGYRYGVVAHASGQLITVIDLDGLEGAEGHPAIVDTYELFDPIGAAFRTGGFGLAQRPCGTCTDADDPEGTNVPTVTQGCTRPMIYAGYRFQIAAGHFTIDGIDDEDLPFGAATRESCYGLAAPNDGALFNGSCVGDCTGTCDGAPIDGEPCVPTEISPGVCLGSCFMFQGPFCAGLDDIGEPCAVICDPQVRNPEVFTVAGVDPLMTANTATLGDIAFADECGEKLYMIQTNPGGLLQLDTSLDIDNEPFDESGPPLELCDQPTRFVVWSEGGFAFVSCYQSAEIFVVDLKAWQVTGTIIAGTGAHDLVIDPVRKMLYAASALEASVSVIDLGEDHPTRFQEVARLGLREPFRR